MKRLKVTAHEECMNCLTCEIVCAESFYKRYEGENLSCLRVDTKKDGSPRVVTCTQCGLCEKACEAEAITQNAKGVYMINKSKCTNCGKCIEACALKVMVMASDREVPSKCIACGLCAKKCPVEILYIEEKE